ncbi:MAG TPA: dynamin family protein [Flexilinea sp.]|jgi:small GTP-binding protein|nr:MAG: Bacterial dynamin-like protein [Chloroflexi bacterium ADurb.Bin344]HOG22305.1 dynamin family protein [Flexilinea sp.]HOG60667.1 dynamin family protein [Flexilinea sp.]HOP02174.1 dynamin family protein [Flexilinea sp.]HOR56857.1 dynamin family protein [Flexilinea sp.]
MAIELSNEQKKIFDNVRNTLTELLAVASRSDVPEKDIETLQNTLKSLEDKFLVVIVGEFNSGKSTFINALLNTDILETGVTPTTSLIHLIRYGEEQSSAPIENWGQLITLPVPLLQSISLVDTPGTNSIFSDHIILTNWFFPRADLVIFITSADRPYTESESRFLQAIREWGKKIIIILNKKDLNESPEELDRIVRFIQENANRQLKSDIPILTVSAKTALRARKENNPELWKKSGFDQLEIFLQEKLNEKSRFKYKMDSALAIGERVANQTLQLLENEIKFYREDLNLADAIQEQTQVYRSEIEREINRSLSEIHAYFSQIKESGNEYFEKLFKVKNIPNLIRKDKTKLEFQNEVLKSLPTDIERKTMEMVENIYLQEQRMTQYATNQIEKRKTQFPGTAISSPELSERSQLLQKMQATIDEMLEKMEKDMAADIGMKHVQTAATTALAIEVSAVGLGAGLTIVATTVATDILGIVAAFWVGVAGFMILPYYRKKSQKEFTAQISEIEEKLINSLQKELNEEIQSQTLQMEQAISPFRQFVSNALDKINNQMHETERLRQQIQELRTKL